MEKKLQPEYWGNDPIRGAALGRVSAGEPESEKVYLRRIRPDSGGYDSGGVYWGIGQPLYHAFSDDDFEDFLRAHNRDDAKEQLKEKHKGIKFFR